jgi:hypothetical protein
LHGIGQREVADNYLAAALNRSTRSLICSAHRLFRFSSSALNWCVAAACCVAAMPGREGRIHLAAADIHSGRSRCTLGKFVFNAVTPPSRIDGSARTGIFWKNKDLGINSDGEILLQRVAPCQ